MPFGPPPPPPRCARRLIRAVVALIAPLAGALTACQDPPTRALTPSVALHSPRAPVFSVAPFQKNCPNQLPTQPVESPYGVNSNRLSYVAGIGDPVAPSTYTGVNQLLGQANAGWLRMDFDIGGLIAASRDTNNLRWAEQDVAVNNALCAGMNILGTLEYTTRASVTRPVQFPGEYYKYLPDNIQDWAAVVRAIVNHYPQIRYWSIWNEPNSLNFFRGYGTETTVDQLVPAYDTLVKYAVPGIRGNVDGQGRRYLVAPELGADGDAAKRWLQRVLTDQGNNIDAVAVHFYGNSRDAANYVGSLPSSAAPPGGWRWPIWLTEVSLPGCDDYSYDKRGVAPLNSYCTGTDRKYIADNYLAAYVDSLMRATRNAYPANATWAKTFYWHAKEEVYRPSPSDTLVDNNRGLIGGARANSIYGRAAYSAFSAVAGTRTLRLSGPTYAYDQNVTIRATATPAGSYYFVWQYKWCYNGNAPHDCDGQWYWLNEGQNLASVTTYVHRQDYYVDFRVKQYTYQNGPLLGSGQWDVAGSGVCSIPQGCNGGGGGGMLAAPQSNTTFNDTTKTPPRPDPSAQRMKGQRPRGNP